MPETPEMLLGKRRPGSSSHGHQWSEPDEVIAVPYADGVELLGIKDADFFHVGETTPEPEAPVFSEVDEAGEEVTEPEGSDLGTALAEARPTRRRAASAPAAE